MKKSKIYGQIGDMVVSEVMWEKIDQKLNIGPRIYNRKVVDIRRWKGDDPDNGIVVPYSAIPLIIIALFDERYLTLDITTQQGVIINKLYGIITEGNNTSLRITECTINGEFHKYDLRYWKKGYKEYSQGISLEKSQALSLSKILCNIADEKGLTIPVLEMPEKVSSLDDFLTTRILVCREFNYVNHKAKLLEEIKNL